VSTTTPNLQTDSDESAILRLLSERLAEGRRVYGPWRVDDGRRYPREALAEVLDALHYCAAELVRLDHVAAGDGPLDVERFARDCERIADDSRKLGGPGAAAVRSGARTLAMAVDLYQQQQRRLAAEELRSNDGGKAVSR
jgi:hypothetical protein